MIEDLRYVVACLVAWIPTLFLAAQQSDFVAWVGMRSSPEPRCSTGDTENAPLLLAWRM
jgi:hypothetical protein